MNTFYILSNVQITGSTSSSNPQNKSAKQVLHIQAAEEETGPARPSSCTAQLIRSRGCF